MKAGRWVKPAIAAALVAAIAVLLLSLGEIDPDRIEAEVQALGFWGPVAYFVLFFLSIVLLGSVSIMTVVAAALFGLEWGFIISQFATILAAIADFFLGRYLFADWVTRKAGGRFKKILDGVESEGWHFVTFIRLVPIFQFASLSYLLGATRVRFSHYVVPTFICLIPGIAAFSWLGHTGREAAAGGDAKQVVTNLMLALGFIAILAIIPRIMKHLRRRNGIEIEDVVAIHEAGEPIVVVVVGSPEITGLIETETVGDSDLKVWITANRERQQTPFVVAASNDSLALKASRQMRNAGYQDVRYLFGGYGALQANAGMANASTPA